MSLRTSSRPAPDRMTGHRPILCYVTDRRSFHGELPAELRKILLNRIEEAARAGVDWIQLREKDLLGRDSAALTREALHRLKKCSSGETPRLLVNDRLDVALAEQAGGVHLSETALPVQEIRRMLQISPAARPLQGNFLIGASCHSPEAAKSAASTGADYIFFGPVFATPSKAAHGPPQGLERLAVVCSSVEIPVFAIGGITLENAPGCLAVGAAGIAAIRLFQDTADLPRLVQTLRNLRS